MNRKPNLFSKLSDFVTGKGFYLVVLLCVSAIALSGYYLVRSMQDTLDRELTDQPVSNTATIVVTPPPAVVTTKPTPSVEPTAAPTAAPTPVPTLAATPAPTQASAQLVFTWPVSGAVLAPFSVDVLSYDETMGDWRTHGGMDIAADIGVEVRATAAGTVRAVYDDPLMGTTVEVDHGNGLVSVYANLAAMPAVAEGDQVSTGSTLGAVGDTAAAERGRANHLHFAMLKDGTATDPERYLPEK